MSNAAVYARVSSARKKEQETIRSQPAALRAHAEQLGLEVAEPLNRLFFTGGRQPRSNRLAVVRSR